MPLPEAPTLEFLEATETTIQVEFKPGESSATYELQWKPIEAGWDSAASAAVQSSGTIKTCKTEAYNLEPGTTYCVRLVCIQDGEKGIPSKELILDTEQVGCAPKNEGGCGCTIQ
ncbi:MAG: hypothetical protein SGBAC_005527 [Bacillariaceae sp.]